MMLKVYGDSTSCKSSSGCSGTMHRFFNDGEYHRLNVEIQQLEDKKKRLQEIIADLEKRIVLQRKARADTAQNYSDLQMHQQSIMSLLVFGSGEDPETAVAFIDKALVSLGDYQAVGFDVDGEAQKKTVDDSESNADKSAGKRLTPEEVNDRWKQVVESIDEQIENYKEALMNRGVPECSWLKKTLAKHRAKMLEQEGSMLRAAIVTTVLIPQTHTHIHRTILRFMMKWRGNFEAIVSAELILGTVTDRNGITIAKDVCLLMSYDEEAWTLRCILQLMALTIYHTIRLMFGSHQLYSPDQVMEGQISKER